MALTQCQFDQVSGLRGCRNIFIQNERYLCSNYLRGSITGDENFGYDGYPLILRFATLFRFDRQIFADYAREEGALEFFGPLIHSIFFWFTVVFFFLSVLASLILFKLLRSKPNKTKPNAKTQSPPSPTATCIHCLWATLLLTAGVLTLIRAHVYFTNFRDDFQAIACRLTHISNNLLYHTQVLPGRPPITYKGFLSQYLMIQSLQNESKSLAEHFEDMQGPIARIGRPMLESVLAPIIWTGKNLDGNATFRGWPSRDGRTDKEFDFSTDQAPYRQAELWMKDKVNNPFGKTLEFLEQSSTTFDGSAISSALTSAGASLESVKNHMDDFAADISEYVHTLNKIILSFLQGSWAKVKWLHFSAALIIKLSIALLVASVLVWVQIVFTDNRRRKVPSGIKLYLLFTLIGMPLYQGLGWIGMIVSGWGGSMCDFVETDLINGGGWRDFSRTSDIPAEVVGACLNTSSARRGLLKEYGVDFEDLWKRENFVPDLRKSVDSAVLSTAVDMSEVLMYLNGHSAEIQNLTSEGVGDLVELISEYFGTKRARVCVEGDGRCNDSLVRLNQWIIYNENVSREALSSPLEVAAMTTNSDQLLTVFPIDLRAYTFADLLQQAAKRNILLTDFYLSYAQSPHIFSHCPTFTCPLFWGLDPDLLTLRQITYAQWRTSQSDIIAVLKPVQSVGALLQAATAASQSVNPIATLKQQVALHDSDFDCSLLLQNAKQFHYYTCQRAMGNLGLLSLSWLQLSLVHYAAFLLLAIYWKHRAQAAAPPPPTNPSNAAPKHSEFKGNFLAAAMQGDINALIALRPYIDISNCKDEMYGNTPLHLAAVHGHIDCVEWLLYAGVNPNQRNNMGHTPLSALVNTITMPEERKGKILLLLKDHGAKID